MDPAFPRAALLPRRGPAKPRSQPVVRIVSLLSSATEIVHLLGLQDSLVGISHECDYPAELLDRPRISRIRFDPAGLDSAQIDTAVRESMERFGSVYEVDEAMLRSLQPDLVLTQAVCEVCAVPTASVREVAALLPRIPEVVSLDAHTVEDILASVELVASAAGLPGKGNDAAAELRWRLTQVERSVSERPLPRVLMLEWLDPPFVPGHWVPEMVARAGGECVAGRAGERSREVSWQELEDLDPDVLLVEPCGYDLERSRDDARRFRERLVAIAPRAVGTGRAWAVDSGWFSRSGPRIVAGVEALAALLHPDVFPESVDPAIAAPFA